MNDYAKEYDLSVIHGDRITDQDVKQACRIDLVNRKKSKLKDYPYYYDLTVANRYVTLAKLISPRKLASFQLAFISIVNGWRLKSNPKIRRYQEALYTCSRKNAKSYEESLILCSELLKGEIEKKTNQQLFVLATNKTQAMLTLNQAKDMIKRLQQNSELARNFKINKTMIYSTVTGSRIEALSSRPGALNGLNPTVVDIDEVEAMKDDKLIQVIKSAMALQPNGLMLMTSTAGFVTSSPVRTEWKACESALKKHDLNSRLFGFIYSQDNRKEIFKNPKTWIKSNPLMEVPSVKSVMMPYLKQQIHSALVMNTTNSTITKNFNMFGNNNDSSFISPDKWEATTIKPIDPHSRKNVSIGLDLSVTHDITAINWTFGIGNGKYYTDTYGFIPNPDNNIKAKSRADGINYEAMQDAGFCTISKASYGVVDFRQVAKFIKKDLIKKYNWKNVYIGFDPWHSNDIIQLLGSDDNIKLVKVNQSPKNLTDVVSWLYTLIVTHKILHKNNLLFNYGFHNILEKETSTGSPYFSKANNRSKVDFVFSLLDSLKIQQTIKRNDNQPSLSEELNHNDFTF